VEGVRTEEGLGSRVIKDLSRHLVGKNHVIYMDNFFSNPALFESLLAEGIYLPCSGYKVSLLNSKSVTLFF
jgi:hypothetical protein